MPTQRIIERLQMVEAFPPVNLNAGANTGAYVNLLQYMRWACVLVGAPGTISNDAIITLQQAKNVSGGSVKNLTVITTGYSKIAATNLSATGQWTKTTQAAANTFTKVASANDSMLWVEGTADQLDVSNGFCCLRMTVAATGATQTGYGFYLLADPRYPDSGENMISALV